MATFSRGMDGTWKRTGTLSGEGLFGWKLAVRENVAVIGSTSHVHIFKFEKAAARWKLLNQFRHDVPRGGIDNLDYQDGRIVVGSAGDRRVTVYDIDAAGSIVRQTRLTPRSGAPDDRFGFEVAMTRNIVVAGAPGFAGSKSTGAVYIFRLRDGQWRETQTLRPSDGAPGDLFGFAVAIDKGMVLVGAPRHQRTSAPVAAGAVYVYTPEGGPWQFLTKLRPTPEEHPSYAAFGMQIAMFDTKAAVVATDPRETTPDEQFSGLVFAYDRVGSDLTAYSVARPQSGLRLSAAGFGESNVGVSIFGMTLLAGSPLSQCGPLGCSGNAIMFDLRQTEPFP